MIRIKTQKMRSRTPSPLTKTPKESYVEKMKNLDEKDKMEVPEFTKSEEILKSLMKKEEDYPQVKFQKRNSQLTKSLKKNLATGVTKAISTPPPTSPLKKRVSFSFSASPRSISPSLSSGSSTHGSPLNLPIPRSITPIASPVDHQALALCAELDIDPLTLDEHGALKRGIDLQGIALCGQNGIHLYELQKYKAVRRDIDITGISMCKSNGVEIEVLFKMNAIEPKIDISGIAICEAMGIDIYALQDYGFVEPGRSLRTVAMLKQQGYDMEEIFLMNPGFNCTS